MTTSPILGAPELAAGQAVPETTVNEQLRYAEQGAGFYRFMDRDLTAPPGSPADGDCYLVADSATGGWAGKDGLIAFRMSTGWLYITPREGFAAYVIDEAVNVQFDGADWIEFAGGGDGGGGGGGPVPDYILAYDWGVETVQPGSAASTASAASEIEFLDADGILIPPSGGFAFDTAMEAGYDGAEAFDGVVASGNGYKHQVLSGSAVGCRVGYRYGSQVRPRYVRISPIPSEEDEAPESFAVVYRNDDGDFTTLTTISTTWPSDTPQEFDLYGDAAYVQKSGDTMTGPLEVPDDAYDATDWNANNEVPTKNALRDKIEAIIAGIPGTYTDEMARDAIGAALTDTGLAVVTVNDGGDTIDINVPAAVASDLNTGSDTTKAVTADALAGSNLGKAIVTLLVSDPAGSAITTGDGKAYYRIPAAMNGMNLVAVAAHITTVSSSGTPTIQIHNLTQAADMLTTRITIDASETDSSTAAAAAVIDTGNDDVAAGDMLRVDIDVAGTGAKGLIVQMEFQLP